MTEQDPATRSLGISEVRNRLAPLADEVSRGEIRVIVAKSGSPVAALVSIDDLKRWSLQDAQREAHLAVIDRMRAAFADTPTEEIEQEVARALSEVRAEMVAERE